MIAPRSAVAFSIFLLLLTVTVTACERGQYKTPVDGSVQPQYDTTRRTMVDDGSNYVNARAQRDAAPKVIAETDEEFTQPPTTTVNSPIDERGRFVGRDAVRFYIWNDRGSAQLFLAEGETASIPAVGQTIQVNAIGNNNGGQVYFILDGKQVPILRSREQVKHGSTYIFVSEILLNEAQE